MENTVKISQFEESRKITESNWNLRLENKTGDITEFTLLSGLDSLQLLLNFLNKGFSYGNVDRNIWCVQIIRGQESLEVIKSEDLNEQVIKLKWPDYNNHKSSQLLPLHPQFSKWVDGKIKLIHEHQMEDGFRTILGNGDELESILKQVFTLKV